MRETGTMLVLSLWAVMGCHEPPQTMGSSVVQAEVPVLAPGVTMNALKWQDLPKYALSTKSLAGPQFAELLAKDGHVRSLMKYFVECALPQGAKVSLLLGGKETVFEGWSGLAPQWQTGPCDESCQRWVSACLLARTNAYGIPVRIQIRAPSPTHYDDTGKAPEELFVVEEGAFFGNVFQHPMRRYSCRGRGFDPFMMTFRNCAMRDNGCGIMHVGTCGDHDGTLGGPGEQVVCEDFDAKQGVYKRCHSRAADPKTGAFSGESELYEEVVTLWVKRTRFVETATAPICADPPSPGPAPYVGPAKASPSGANTGHHCTDEDDCDGGTQVCSRQFTYGICTEPCTNSANPSAEASQCGGAGTTCLQLSDGGLCTRGCTPGLAPGAPKGCSKFQVCTGMWLFNYPNDAPGCYVHCSDDSDCWPFIPCNTRTGSCGAVADESALPDVATLALAGGAAAAILDGRVGALTAFAAVGGAFVAVLAVFGHAFALPLVAGVVGRAGVVVVAGGAVCSRLIDALAGHAVHRSPAGWQWAVAVAAACARVQEHRGVGVVGLAIRSARAAIARFGGGVRHRGGVRCGACGVDRGGAGGVDRGGARLLDCGRVLGCCGVDGRVHRIRRRVGGGALLGAAGQ